MFSFSPIPEGSHALCPKCGGLAQLGALGGGCLRCGHLFGKDGGEAPQELKDAFEASSTQCPKCGGGAMVGPTSACCFQCGYIFGEDGDDLSHQIKEVSAAWQRSHDRLVRRLFDQARRQLDGPTPESPARAAIRRFLDWSDPRRRRDKDPLVECLLLELVGQAREYQRLRRPRTDQAVDRDAEAGAGGAEDTPPNPEEIFDQDLTPVFVLDFIAECERRLCVLSPEDWQLLKMRLGADPGERNAREPLHDHRGDDLLMRITSHWRDRFLWTLFDEARRQLDGPTLESPARADVRRFLDRIDPRRRRELDFLGPSLVSTLVDHTREYQKFRSVRTEDALDQDAEAETSRSWDTIFGRQPTPVFVLDFIAECEHFLNELSPKNRRLLETCLGADQGGESGREPFNAHGYAELSVWITTQHKGRCP